MNVNSSKEVSGEPISNQSPIGTSEQLEGSGISHLSNDLLNAVRASITATGVSASQSSYQDQRVYTVNTGGKKERVNLRRLSSS